MAITLPKYGTVVPSPTTRMRDLGRELQEFGESVESILESFDYNGADPNLVLSRMSALEIEAADLRDRADAIEAQLSDTGWVSVTPKSPVTGVIQWRRVRDEVHVRFNISHYLSPNTQISIVSLPGSVSPNGVSVPISSRGGNSFITTIVSTNGQIYVRNTSAAGESAHNGYGSWLIG